MIIWKNFKQFYFNLKIIFNMRTINTTTRIKKKKEYFIYSFVWKFIIEKDNNYNGMFIAFPPKYSSQKLE